MCEGTRLGTQDTGHGMRAATGRLFNRSSRSSSRYLRLLARLSRHRSRRPRPPPRVRRPWRGPPPGARAPSNLRVTCHRSARTSITHLPSTPPGARAVGAAVHTAAAHRRRLVRAPLLGRARRTHPPRLLFARTDVVSPPAASLTAPLCRYVPLGRAGDRSFKMKSKERHALLARYAARFNRPRDEAPRRRRRAATAAAISFSARFA